MNPRMIGGLIVAVLVLIVGFASVFTVDLREQAVVTRLGEVRRTVTEAGLHSKVPFLDKVHTFNKMMVESDPTTEDQIYTADKKILLLDNYAIWQIVDPVLFLKAFPGGEFFAEKRLGEVVFSALRQELGRHTQDEVVVTRREMIMDSVSIISDRAMRPTGVRVVDVRIKRADLPPENARSVFNRMVAERQREATRYRSNGEREGSRIRAEAERDARVTLASARQRSEATRGDGDAKALAAYARAYQRDPRFYEFTRTLQAYEATVDSQSVIVLTSQSEFARRFFRGKR